MTCVRMTNNAIVCVSSHWGRLHLGNRYVWVDMHPYCGPSFFTDSNMSKVYDPQDEDDPIWPLFSAWLKREDAKKLKAIQKGQP